MTQSLFDCSQEVAVVIGGAGVLGGGIAEGLSAQGARIVICDPFVEKGEERVAAINAAGGKAFFVKGDATDPESMRQAEAEISKHFAPPTVLVNAAGGNNPKVTVADGLAFEDIALENWQASFNLNLVGGCFAPCQAFGPGMLARGKGSIINIASVSAHLPLSRVVAYSAAKAAVLNLTRFLAREWAEGGVRVNSITPGFFPAEQNRRLLYNEDGSPTERTEQILGHTPMKRFGTAQELIGAAVYLAAPAASSFVTGADLRVDGGFLAQTI